jgi:hypothetical protein
MKRVFCYLFLWAWKTTPYKILTPTSLVKESHEWSSDSEKQDKEGMTKILMRGTHTDHAG